MRIPYKNRIVLAGVIVNLLAMFDLAVCSLLSIYLIMQYQQSLTSSVVMLMLSIAVLVYLSCAIGAIVLGVCSDVYGRKKIVSLSLIIMSIATAGIVLLLPNAYQNMGSLSILLLLCCMQSFYFGFTSVNVGSFVIESSDIPDRGFIGSWSAFGTILGLLLASVMMFMLVEFVHLYPQAQWWLWRLPLLLAVFGVILGYYIRTRLPESLDYILHYGLNTRSNVFLILKQALIYLSNNIKKCFYVLLFNILNILMIGLVYIYPLIHIQIYKIFNIISIIFSDLVSLYIMVSVLPIIGKLVDIINRNKIILYTAISFIILLLPFFYFLCYKHLLFFMLIQAVIALPIAGYLATLPVILTEMFPLELRCTLLGIIYAVAVSVVVSVICVLLYKH